jgi:hypothetical protein
VPPSATVLLGALVAEKDRPSEPDDATEDYDAVKSKLL